MHKVDRKKILAAVGDLFFTIKIRDTARKSGLDVEFVKSDKDLLELAKQKPALIILRCELLTPQYLTRLSDLLAFESCLGGGHLVGGWGLAGGHHVGEAVEEVRGVVRAGAGLGVVLDRENRQIAVGKTL